MGETAKIHALKKKLESASYDIRVILDQGRKAEKDAQQLSIFKGMYTANERYFNKFEETWDALEEEYHSLESESIVFPSEIQKTLRTTTKRSYFENIILYQTLCQDRNEPIASGSTSSNRTLFESRPISHLPIINLPKFNGNLLEWSKWKDMYVSLVHANDELSNVRKFHYLTTSLIGNASTVISHLNITDNNYDLAWQSLIDTFDNSRVLANTYLNQLLNFKPLTGKPTVDSLRLFLSQVADNISAFKLLKINNESEFILFYLASKCLDPFTKEHFELAHKNELFPTFDSLKTFIKERCNAMQLAESQIFLKPKDNNTKGHHLSHNKTSTLSATSNIICFICKNNHSIYNCDQFKSATVETRHSLLNNWRGCKNCLGNNHKTSICKSKWRCKICGNKHHSLLHFATSPSKSPNISIPHVNVEPSSSNSSAMTTVANSNADLPKNYTVILGTVLAEFKNAQGNYTILRGLVDCGSQHSFITVKGINKLGLDFQKLRKKIYGIGQTIFEGTKGQVICNFRPTNNRSTHQLTVQAIVVSNITNYLPNTIFSKQSIKQYEQYCLADPTFWQPAPIDFLFGADIYTKIMNGQPFSINNKLPTMFPSIFGNIVMGCLYENNKSNTSTSLLASLPVDDLNENLSKFWSIEELKDNKVKVSNPDDDWCENHFIQTHYRSNDGRYVVRLPFKSHFSHFDNFNPIVRKRFENLEHKLCKDLQHYSLYKEFMHDYLNLNHMAETNSPSRYIIPHHSVFKEDRNLLKIRVVFDASFKTTKGSLNEYLHSGPKLQNDIRDLLLNWRTYNVVFVADIEKMYRQILVHYEDRQYQHIYWRFNTHEAIKKYELNTITYGMTCSPWLSLRVLKQLVIDEGLNFPNASKVLESDIFIDDIVTGAKSLSDALFLQQELIQLLRKGGFELKKWASNKEEITQIALEHECNESKSFIPHNELSLKILGLIWFPKGDYFSFKINITKPLKYTKRGILSLIASIYDPIGFIAPSIILMKSYIQTLWKAGLDWDDKVPVSLYESWKQIISELPDLAQLKIPRLVCTNDATAYQIIGFADASSMAYCATLYLRCISSKDVINIYFLTAKTRLAPVKTVSIPKLELCAAHLLARVYISISPFIKCLDKPLLQPLFFTDSTIVLAWLKTLPCNLKVFVGNRVSEIITTTNLSSWKYVESIQNPSDLGTRGVMPSKLKNATLWWTGPEWLQKDESKWSTKNVCYPSEVPEIKENKYVLLTTPPYEIDSQWVTRFSSYFTLLRVTARLLRLFHNYKNKQNIQNGIISIIELKEALRVIVRMTQKQYFSEANSYEKTLVKFSHLDIFEDEVGILRVGGRLRYSTLPYGQKHPILLPKQCHFANLIVDMYHQMNMHAGRNLLQGLIQLKFWILGLRVVINKRIFRCVKCQRIKGKTIEVKMADLPKYRLHQGQCFIHVGTDFAGPFSIRENLRRKAPITKGYLCLFVCLVTKALHLELVTNLTTDCFLSAFDRFVSRRGLPVALYSDNGTTYVGASNKLKEIEKWLKTDSVQESLSRYASNKGVEWHFMPPYSPNFCGIAEAGVKSVKTLLKKIAGDASLTIEEIITFFSKIEAILNSRPLSLLSNDPNEINYLSPGHFLIGRPLVAHPEPSFLDFKESLLNRWQLVKKMSEYFWSRWRIEYLATLQNRVKWHKYRPEKPYICAGDIVFVKEDKCPMMQWPLGKVIKTHPGRDGFIRVATIKTAKSIIKRPVRKLILLPVVHND